MIIVCILDFFCEDISYSNFLYNSFFLAPLSNPFKNIFSLFNFFFYAVTGSNNEDEKDKTKIKDKLKRYLSKRPSFNELESKGIITG